MTRAINQPCFRAASANLVEAANGHAQMMQVSVQRWQKHQPITGFQA